MLMPVGMTIVLRAAGEGENGRLMSMLGIPPLIGPLIGPVLGGLLIDAASWRWIFLINVPVGLVGVLLAARLLPTDPTRTRRSLDWIGLALLSCGLAVLVFGLTGGGIMFAALGGLFGAGFVVRSLTTDEPLIELRLFRRRRLAASALTLTFAAAAYFGSMVLLPLYYQMVRGEDAHTTGLLSIPQVVATGLTMQVATRLVDRVPPGRVVALGTIIAPTGVLLFAVLVSADTPYWQLMAAMSVMGVGIGMTLMPATAAGTRGLTHDEVPSASTADDHSAGRGRVGHCRVLGRARAVRHRAPARGAGSRAGLPTSRVFPSSPGGCFPFHLPVGGRNIGRCASPRTAPSTPTHRGMTCTQYDCTPSAFPTT